MRMASYLKTLIIHRREHIHGLYGMRMHSFIAHDEYQIRFLCHNVQHNVRYSTTYSVHVLKQKLRGKIQLVYTGSNGASNTCRGAADADTNDFPCIH